MIPLSMYKMKSVLMWRFTADLFLCPLLMKSWRGMLLLGYFLPFYKGDNFCDFLFGFLHTKSLLKRVLL